jgi:hypothetical protein
LNKSLSVEVKKSYKILKKTTKKFIIPYPLNPEKIKKKKEKKEKSGFLSHSLS